MKKKIFIEKTARRFVLRILLILSLGMIGAWAVPPTASAQHVSVSLSLFYNRLRPYGRWIEYPRYGRVWIPSVAVGFSPYATGGHWEYTDYGWSWVSDYPWGWAAFHYGRWLYDPAYGWLWVPDTEWGPAWVAWSDADDYYGWAPLPPGVGINVSIGIIPAERWFFVPHGYIGYRHIDHYFVDHVERVRLVRDARVIHNFHEDHGRHTRYIAGPSRVDVQRATASGGGPPRRTAGIQQSNTAAPQNVTPQRSGRETIQSHPAPQAAPAQQNNVVPQRGNHNGFHGRHATQQNPQTSPVPAGQGRNDKHQAHQQGGGSQAQHAAPSHGGGRRTRR